MNGGISRREFLTYAAGTALGAGFGAALCTAPCALARNGRGKGSWLSGTGRDAWHPVPRDLWEQLPDGELRCLICPHGCVLAPGEVSACRTRWNRDGRFESHAYGNPCILAVDPVEKKPLYHFLPGSETLSLAVGGCNLRCLYCQNWRESQTRPENLRTFQVSPNRLVAGAKDKKTPIVAYTYTEPVAYYEYCLDSAAAAKEQGLRNVMVTSLFIRRQPLLKLCEVVDGVAMTLKGFDETFYRDVIGGELKPVLAALETVKSKGVWVEIINLVVPRYNDDPKKVKAMCQWIRRNLGSDQPLHFSRFVPMYKMKDLPRTPLDTLERCREIALAEGLRHVYLGNVSPHEGNHTYCHSCKKPVIKRLGFTITDRAIRNGRCGHCGRALPGVWK